jgi:RHS repeat-associated protein
MKTVYSFCRFFALLAVWLVLLPPAASAQCTDTPCNVPDVTGPSITITPDGETYHVDEGTSHPVSVTIHLFDRSGIDPLTYTIQTDGVDLSSLTNESFDGGTTYTLSGEVYVRRLGSSTFTFGARDKLGNEHTATATYRVEFTDPELPIVDADVHHNEFRDTTASQLQLSFTTTPYISLDTPRSVSLVYSSELASPNAYVQVDAKPDPRTAANVVAMSMVVTDSEGRVVGREYFWRRNPTGENQRMAAFWSMRTRATGAYNYTVAVRSHLASGPPREKRVPVRVLIVNESASRYGAGWTVGGLPRIYGAVGGVILHEGDGRLRWYGSIPCSPTFCAFQRPEGDFSDLTLDRVAGVWTRVHPDNSVTKFDIRGLITSATDSLGRSVNFAWQTTGDAAAVPVLASITDPMQKVTTFTYTPSGYLQKITDPAGRVASFTINASGDLVSMAGETNMQVSYNTTHLPVTFTNESGTWDPRFYRGTFSSLTAPSIKASGSDVRLVTKFHRAEWKTTLLSTEGTSLTNLAPALDSAQAVEAIADARGHVVAATTKNRYGQPLSITDLEGGVTKITYTRHGLPSTNVDPDGKKTEYAWNARGQLISVKEGGFSAWQAVYESRTDRPDYEISQGTTTWFSWGSRGQLMHSWYGEQTDYESNGTDYGYDALYRPASVTGAKGERVEWTYGDWGNTATERVVLADGTVNETTYTYDAAGRPHTTTNALGQCTITAHDSRNRLREVTDPLGRVTKMDYNGDLLTRVTDPAGKVFGFNYNALGWLESETLPGSTIPRTYTYNADGLLLSKTDRRSSTVSYTYDNSHRPLTRTADGAATTYSYPDRNTVISTNPEGSITTKLNPDFNQLDSVRMTLAGLPGRVYELKLAIDPDDPLNPVGNDLNYYINDVLQRSAAYRYRSIAGSEEGAQMIFTDPQGAVTTLTFNGSKQHVRTTFPNGVVQNYAIGTDGRNAGTSFTSSSLNQALGVSYKYDRIHRLTEMTNSTGNMKWGYKYTLTGMLESYQQSASLPPIGCNSTKQTCDPVWSTIRSAAYTYDNTGNRTDSGSVVAPDSNRYSAFAGYALQYDLEGNLIRRTKAGFDQRLTWNSLGQLASVTTNGDLLTFGYDPVGRRVRRTTGGSSRYFLYEDDDLLLELGPDGAPSREYHYLPGTDNPLSVRENIPGGHLVYYYVLERTGHVRALLDQNGTIVGEYQYTPYGEPIATSAGDGSAQPLRYMGRELDAGIRLYYVRHRWYDPELGRFITEDPIGLAGGVNTYAYVENDPINRRDPSGLQWTQDKPLMLDTVIVEACSSTGPPVACRMWFKSDPFTTWDLTRAEQDAYVPGDYLRVTEPRRLDKYEQWAHDIAGGTGWLNSYTMAWVKVYSFAIPGGGAARAGNAVRGSLYLSSRHRTTVIGRMKDLDEYAAQFPGVNRGGWADWNRLNLRERHYRLWGFVREAVNRGDRIRNISPDRGGYWTRVEEVMARISGYHVFP